MKYSMELTVIQKRIFEIRGQRVMLDRDLAELYGVETRTLVQAVKRNINRFPGDFMFQLTKQELKNWKSQIVISNRERMGIRKLPYAFTEHGVAMLASVLKSKKAIDLNVAIVRAFILLRQMAISHKDLLKKIEELEKRYNKNFHEIYEVLEELVNPPQPKRKRVGYKHFD